jgi:hypothetical protein
MNRRPTNAKHWNVLVFPGDACEWQQLDFVEDRIEYVIPYMML